MEFDEDDAMHRAIILTQKVKKAKDAEKLT